MREFDLMDFDGDGLIDHVEREDGEWRVFRHPASPLSNNGTTPAFRRYRPNLLVAMMNGVGGQTSLEYASVATLAGNRLPYPAWVLTKQEVFDGVHDTAAGSTTFRYRDAAYDAEDAEFRGFRLVWQEDAGGRPTATEFHQDDTRAGLGVKYGVTSNLIADLAVTPDFSQIESDAGVVDINERFAIFFPEKRPLFLESVDLFSIPLQAVYTRPITDQSWGACATGDVKKTKYTLFIGQDQGGGLVILPRANGSAPGPSSGAEVPPALRLPDEGHFNAAGNEAVAGLVQWLLRGERSASGS